MPTNVNAIVNNGAGFNQIPEVNAQFYSKRLLDRLLPELFFAKYGEKYVGLPKKAGDTISFRRWNSLTTNTTALTEGLTPDGVDLSVTKVNATVDQYGNWTKFSDFVDLVGLDPVLTEVSELMGENAGESIDLVIRDVIAAGTNVIYAANKTARNEISATEKISAADILKVRRKLKRAKVKPVTLPGGGKGYIWFAHTDVITDLMQTTEWKDQNTYVNTKNREEGIAGKLYGIYFIEADNAPKYAGEGAGTTTKADVYGNIIIGKGAYGVPDVEGSSKPEIIIHKAGSAGTSDPLNQFNTVGWKACFTALILNQLCLVRYECGATV